MTQRRSPFSREAATAHSRGRQPTVTDKNKHQSREAAAADAVAVAASRLGRFSPCSCGLTPAATCCRRFATQNRATSKFWPVVPGTGVVRFGVTVLAILLLTVATVPESANAVDKLALRRKQIDQQRARAMAQDGRPRGARAEVPRSARARACVGAA